LIQIEILSQTKEDKYF